MPFPNVMKKRSNERRSVLSQLLLDSPGNRKGMSLVDGVLIPEQRCLFPAKQAIDPLLVSRAERSAEEHSEKARNQVTGSL
jgi:hypothetical protein